MTVKTKAVVTVDDLGEGFEINDVSKLINVKLSSQSYTASSGVKKVGNDFQAAVDNLTISKNVRGELEAVNIYYEFIRDISTRKVVVKLDTLSITKGDFVYTKKQRNLRDHVGLSFFTMGYGTSLDLRNSGIDLALEQKLIELGVADEGPNEDGFLSSTGDIVLQTMSTPYIQADHDHDKELYTSGSNEGKATQYLYLPKKRSNKYIVLRRKTNGAYDATPPAHIDRKKPYSILSLVENPGGNGQQYSVVYTAWEILEGEEKLPPAANPTFTCETIQNLPKVEWKDGTTILAQQDGRCVRVEMPKPPIKPTYEIMGTAVKKFDAVSNAKFSSEAFDFAQGEGDVGSRFDVLVMIQNNSTTAVNIVGKLTGAVGEATRHGSDTGNCFKVVNFDTNGFDMKGASFTGSITDGTYGKHLSINNIPANDFIVFKATLEVTKKPATKRAILRAEVNSIRNHTIPSEYDQNKLSVNPHGIYIRWKPFFLAEEYQDAVNAINRTFNLAEYDANLGNGITDLYRKNRDLPPGETVEFAPGQSMPPRQAGTYNIRLVINFDDNSTINLNPTIIIK